MPTAPNTASPSRIAELVHQAPVAGGFLNGIEVRTLHVLDEGVFERGPIVDLNDDHRHLVHVGHLRRAPAPLAGDDFIHRGLIGHRPHHNRLHDAALADRPGQGFDLICFEVLARIARIAAQELSRDLALPQLSLGRRLVVIADEGRQAASEPETDRLLRHDASPLLSTSVRQHGPHHHVPSRPRRRLTPTPKVPYAPHAQPPRTRNAEQTGPTHRRTSLGRTVRRTPPQAPSKQTSPPPLARRKMEGPAVPPRNEGAPTRFRARVMRLAAPT